MSSQRTHVVLPAELIKEIDALVGKRGRSAFLTELAQQEIIRRKQLKMLENLPQVPVADLADHPEWENSAEWVGKLRQEDQRLRDKKLRTHELDSSTGHKHSR